MIIHEGLTYDDLTLKPKLSDIPNRNESNISLMNNLGEIQFTLPVISSPMDTVTEGDMVLAMRNHGGLGIVHRFNEILEQAAITRECGAEAAAIGMTGDYLERAWVLVENGVKILCIDTAHGYHMQMKRAIESLRNQHGNNVHIMAGSIATEEAAAALCDWGADSVRVGIGGGSICSTRLQTGFGVPNVTAIHEARLAVSSHNYRNKADVKIVADGGVRKSGDMIKAFALGADFVMLGSMLAGTDETPGELLETQDGPKKKYRGMASREAQHNWRGTSSAPEGVSVMIPYKGPVDKVLENLPGWLRSGFSYVGARNVRQLRERAEFYRQSVAGVAEGQTHINHI